MRLHHIFAALLACSLFSSCTIVDLRLQPDRSVRTSGFITGFASAGWLEDDSIVQVDLFKGPNRGSLLYVQIWKLLRVNIGLVGVAVGVGPLDAGIGVLFHKPRPPRYMGDDEDEDDDYWDCEWECRWEGHWGDSDEKEDEEGEDEDYAAAYFLPRIQVDKHVHQHVHQVIR